MAPVLVAAAVEGAHLAPAVSRLAPVRRLVCRELAGYGRPAHVALTFDDGPDPEGTPRFLELLDRLEVRATFFLLGSALERSPELGRELVERGHEVAVHGWYHRVPWRPAPRRDLGELTRAVELVTEVCGQRPYWYRPPYGVLSRGLREAARRLGLRPVLWTAWGREWTAGASPASVGETLLAGLGGGATVLLHDSDCTSPAGSWRAALGALPQAVERCRRLGLEVGPLGEHGLR